LTEILFQAGTGQVQAFQVLQVQQVQASLGGNPQSLETVLADVPDEVAPERLRGGSTESQEIIAVVSAQPSSGCGKPQEAGTVHAQVVDIVAGKAFFHGQGSLEILLAKGFLGAGRTGTETERQEGAEEYEYYTCKVQMSTFHCSNLLIFA
jgi:hypothetical protein